MSDLVKRLRQTALPDPHDEREVMHAHLLREAADEIERLRLVGCRCTIAQKTEGGGCAICTANQCREK